MPRKILHTSVKEFWPAETRGELDRKEKGASIYNQLISGQLGDGADPSQAGGPL